MKQQKWFDRKFDFTDNGHSFPALLARLAATPDRLDELVLDIPVPISIRSNAGKWSIKEHIGHLTDLEPLWQGRLADLMNGEKELRATDLENTKTHLAGHHASPLKELLAAFRDTRLQTIQKLQLMDDADRLRSALHPRLKTPMRMVDHLFFVAEHDDHHLASIIEILS